MKASVKRWPSRYSELFIAEFRLLVANAPDALDDIQGEVREMLEALYRAVELGEVELEDFVSPGLSFPVYPREPHVTASTDSGALRSLATQKQF